MNKKESWKSFEEWLSAYTDRLHMVWQSKGSDLVRPDVSRPPLPTDKSTAGNSTNPKAKNA